MFFGCSFLTSVFVERVILNALALLKPIDIGHPYIAFVLIQFWFLNKKNDDLSVNKNSVSTSCTGCYWVYLLFKR